MESLLNMALSNLLSPVILCFGLGLLAGAVKSDLVIPEPIVKAISLYLMLAIGLKGGASLAESELGWGLVRDLGVAVILSFLIPVIAFGLLRLMTRLDRINAAAVSAHYGSISIVTFAAATQFLSVQGLDFEGHIIAMVALMETPAIITGLLLAQYNPPEDHRKSPRMRAGINRELLREILFNGSVMLLVGGFIIGAVTGKEGTQSIAPLFFDPFKGVLCLFLLDMGLVVARGFGTFRRLGVTTVGFGLVMPLVGAMIGIAAGLLMGLSQGGVALIATLCASASYIAVPAAMRIALPRADASIYVTLSLGVTFPFNILVGIPLYLLVTSYLMGAG